MSSSSYSNPYVDKLKVDFAETSLSGDSISKHKGEWAQLFTSRLGKVPAKLVLEIGCSNGKFLNDIAKEQTALAFVGLDWKYKLVYKACEKAKKIENQNTFFIRAEGQQLLDMFAPAELDEVWFFFPDPWAKAKQQKHRLFQEKFLKDLSVAIKPGGRIYIKTDHPGYFQWMMALLGKDVSAALNAVEAHRELAEKSEEHRSRKGRQTLHRTFDNNDVPAVAAESAVHFNLLSWSLDYWSERAKLEKTLNENVPSFWEHVTLFEKLFREDQLPVYFVALERR